ncbi:ferrous iron transport protein A [Nostoc sp. 'Peltigera membranacea cyanobiont' 210A]|uniref:FeoA family protein n=1 Tax=Nostoc sp. 'Peltigera membranacea cyanobiont' 210A TaxID=2014529 RepID=UPI000B95C7DB|nr:FeoA family protein [Nostoc sp. 'Peltigera membranacea cyanobiont' 210A]OYD94898.1 ferrous iron transport protein A [Nostoc sp. 'Peltigera membranacea cyanobiont' 210A]
MFTSFSVTGCSLELLRTGERGIVIFRKTQDETILKKLISIGIIEGTNITIKQHFSSFILNIDNRDFVLDLESVRAIYVRVIDNYIS